MLETKYNYPPVEEIIKSLKSGINLKEQAKSYNIPYKSVLTYFTKHTGIRARDLCKNKNRLIYNYPSVEEVRLNLKNGINLREQSKSYNIPYNSFKHHFYKKGINNSILNNKNYALHKLEQIDFFEQYWVKNLTFSTISKNSNVPLNTLFSWLRNSGITNKQSLQKIKAKKVVELANSLKTINEISVLLNIPKHTVDTILRRNNINPCKNKFRKYKYPPIERIVEDLKKGISLRQQSNRYKITYQSFLRYCKKYSKSEGYSSLGSLKPGKYNYPPIEEILNNLKNNISLKGQSNRYGIPYEAFWWHYNKKIKSAVDKS